MTKTYYTAVANAWERERQQRLEAIQDQERAGFIAEANRLRESASRCQKRVNHFLKLAEEVGE